MTSVKLRPVVATDLDSFFEHQRDPVALRLGALTSRVRHEFDRHWAKILADPTSIIRTVECERAITGYVCSFMRDGLREVAYWYGREHWGKGIATAALRELLAEVRERPLYACVAVNHPASRRVLEKVGFRLAERLPGTGTSDQEIEELLLRLDT